MNVLVLGSGGREHALSWKLGQSSLLRDLYIAPGNAGTALVGTNVPIQVDDFKGIKKLVIEKKIDLVVVGPEVPLVGGIADFFAADKDLKKVGLIGPSAKGAMLEGSKDFAKRFMTKHRIPTAKYASFTASNLADGERFLDTLKAPYVLKADGLAAGKGVLIIDNLKEAKKQLGEMLSGKFGAAGNTVVIEEFLKGVECSAFVITDGESYKILPEAKDYKRIGEGDTGLNTGGMGAVSPVPFCTPEFLDKIENQVIMPTVRGLKEDGIVYKGFIFFGIIKVGQEPYVIEYNCRMGDPETEVVIPRIKSDLLHILEAAAMGNLSECDLHIDTRSAATVVLAAKGYPGSYEKGKEIKGFGRAGESLVFHSGTKQQSNKIVTNGGRVLALTTLAHTLQEAVTTSVESAERIEFSGKYYRRDIGKDMLAMIK